MRTFPPREAGHRDPRSSLLEYGGDGTQQVSQAGIRRLLGGGLGLALLATVVLAWWSWAFGPHPHPLFVDLDYYRAATATAVAGRPLYAALPYPPIALLVIAPLGGLPVVVGNEVWSALSIVVGLLLAYLITQRGLGARGVLIDYRVLGKFGVVATAMFFSWPFQSQLQDGQVTLLIVALALVDLAGLMPRRWQGALVGLGGAIKLLPLIFIPYYIVTGQRRQAATATGSFTVATLIGLALFPADSVVFWSHVGKNDQFGDPSRADNLSIHATIYRVAPSLGPVSAIWLSLALVVAVAALLRAKEHHRRGERLAGALTVGAASTVLSPISWPHYHVWLTLAAIWLVLAATHWRQRLIGIGLYTVYSLPVLIAFSAVQADKMLASAQTLVCVLIGVLGLPHVPDRPEELKTQSASAGAEPVPAQSSSPGA